jgi:hypothetical protein
MKTTGTISLTVTLALLLAGCDALTGGSEAETEGAADAAGAAEGGAPAAAAETGGKPATGAAPATAAIDMGTNTSTYANDGECDDPRFAGNAMAEGLLVVNIGKDAADCQSAFDAGTITLDPLFATPANDAAIIYGDDTGNYTNDGECDDVRFTGDYVETMFYIVDDIGHDANDCRVAVTAGEARWQGSTANPALGLTT